MLNWIKKVLLKFKGYNAKGNDGFVPYKPKAKDWVFGGAEILNPEGDWISYLPEDEYQRRFNLETMSCVTFSACNVCEIFLNFKKEKSLISDVNLKWLKDNGYIVNDKFNFSDRYIALLSFTSKNGNTGSKVFGTIHNYGLIPESMFPWTSEDDTWNEYHDRTKITQEMKNMGYEFKRRFPMNYEIVYRQDFESALKESPLQVYVDGYYTIRNGVLQFSNRMSSHAVVKPKLHKIYDSYEPFLKEVVSNYPYWAGQNTYTGEKYSYGYKVKFNENIIKKKMITTIKQKNQAEIYGVDVEVGEINAFGGWGSYKKFLDAKWCEPFLEVENKYSYLKEKYDKSFVKGKEIGVIE